MINRISIFFLLSISLLPISLISGPAIPDITITFSIIFFLFLIIYQKKYRELLNDNIFRISIIFWFYLLFISFFAENKILSFRDSIIFIRILLIPLLIYYYFSFKTKNLNKLIIIIFISVLFVSIDTFYQFTQYDPETGFGKDLLGFKSEWYGRLTGPFGDELIPGAYLSKFSLIGLLFIFLKLKNKKKLYYFSIPYISFIGFVIYISGERMAYATFLMAIFFLFIFYKNKRIIFLLSIIFIILSSFMIKKIHPFYYDYKILESTPYHLGLKIEKEFKCSDPSVKNCSKIILLQPEFKEVIKKFHLSAYGEIYSLGLNMFKNNIFFGAGLNNFTYLCKNDLKYKKYMKNYSCASHPHNIYVQWLAEAGIFGLIFFIFYLINIFYFLFNKKINEYSLISIATILILFWPIMSTGSLLKNWNGISTFFIIGICLSVTKLKKKPY